MSAAPEGMTDANGSSGWQRLLYLETVHSEIQRNHEQASRSLDEAVAAQDRRNLIIAWDQYRSVVAELSRVTEEIGSLSLVGA